MQDFINEYDRAYKMKDKGLLQHFEVAFEKIMGQWDSLYKQLTDVKVFHELVKDFIALHPNDKLVKQYYAAYKKFDDQPQDGQLYIKLLDAQNRLQNKIKKS